ncbi:copper homeostasis membrane protein CopD [Allorhizobium sp. BGMRC 0089]|uniref:copper homeostasis membrane protein CopD n=1 Tax=Allorhizobium sonneratiae TaxID=2934936 RepID=UPI0020331DE2|nr:copper homeostasis membrane protein CopD [Allorhizobium sonneratiae]
MSPEQILIVSRFAFDSAALLLWGGHVFLWIVLTDPLSARLERRLAPLYDLAITALILGLAGKWAATIALIGNGWSDLGHVSLIRDILLDTRTGLQLGIQMALTLALLVTYGLSKARRPQSVSLLAALLLASMAISGHAAMHDGLLGTLLSASMVLHILAASAWLGFLPPVVVLLEKLASSPRDRDESMEGLIRFSTLGHVAVAVTLITGTLNSWLIVGTLWLRLDVPYQRLLAVKILLALVMTGLAILNRYRFVPRLKTSPDKALHTIRSATLAAIALGLGAIALVAAFGIMDPTPYA